MGATVSTTPLLTAREVAETLRASLDTVYRLAARGALPTVRWSETGPLRFRPEDVDAFLESRLATSPSRGEAVERDAVVPGAPAAPGTPTCEEV